jgi:OOP family OmpA-OmpF porin
MCLAGALAAGMTAGSAALAQQVALDRFDPAPAGDRMFGVESPYAAGEGMPHVALMMDYAHNPYVLHHGPGLTDVGAVVSDQVFLHLNVSIAILNRLNLNFTVPAAIVQDGSDPTNSNGATVASPHDAAFGDVRLGARLRILGEYDAPFQLGVSGYLWLPSGADNAYVSDGAVRGATSLVFGGHVPVFNWSFTAGFQFRPTQTIDTTITEGTNMQIGGGLGFLFADGRAQIGPEIKGSFVLSKPDHTNLNSELLVDARYRLVDDFEVGLGAGPGLSSGFGTPDIRVIGMLAFSPQMKKAAPPDRDGDGVPDAEDACPDIAAPREANPAKPGCPGLVDRDGDGIADDVDACPDVPGVVSTDPSRNGCPVDRDGDGIPDSKDACPDQAGPPNADPARNGCPLPRDMDGDGIPDAEDACPTIPGIKSTDPKQNGCPGDRDGDGIRDDLDACPDVPGVPSKDPKKNGCPRAMVTDKEINILEQVEFETASSKIKPSSDALLEEIAGIFKKFTDIARVEVQGHTDNQGNKIANKTLSQQRADSVKKALVARGIDQKRLVAKGFGSDVPIAGNETEDGRAKNRRVQFVILERAAAKERAAPKAPPAPAPKPEPKAPSPPKKK